MVSSGQVEIDPVSVGMFLLAKMFLQEADGIIHKGVFTTDGVQQFL